MNFKLIGFSIIFFVTIVNVAVAQTKTDSLLELLPKVENKQKVDVLFELCKQQLRIDNKKAAEYGLQALKLADSVKYTDRAAEAAYYLGISEYYQSKHADALRSINKSHQYAVRLNDSALTTKALIMQGIIYSEFAEHEKATSKYYEALKIYEKNGNLGGVSVCYNNLGIIYSKQEEYKKAIDYVQKSMEIQKRLKNWVSVGLIYNNLGELYDLLGKRDTAMRYLKEAIRIYQKEESSCQQSKARCQQYKSLTYSSIASVLIKQRNFDKAKNYLDKALKINNKFGCDTDRAYILINYTRFFKARRKYNAATEKLAEALLLIDSIGAIEFKEEIYEEYYLIYSEIPNYQKALEYHLKYSELKDSIDKSKYNKKILTLQQLFETEQKDKEITLLNTENKVQSEQLKKQKTINYLQVAVLILFIAVAFLVFRMYKKKKNTAQLLEKQNKHISEQSHEIKSQNEQLEAQTKKLQELDELKSQFFTNISHEFRTPLTLILGPAEQMLQNNAHSNELALIIKHAKRLSQLIDQLLEISKIEKGALRLKPIKADFPVFVRTMVGSFESWAVERQLKLNFNSSPESFEACFDKDKMEKVFNNLVSNAIKFSGTASSIDVDLQLIDDSVLLKVRDRGKGIAQKHLKNIFDRFYRIEGQDNSVGTGIGLSLTKELVQLHGGTIQVESETNEGTTFIVTIPAKQEIGAGQEFQETHLENPKNVPLKEVAESTLLANTEKETKTTGKSVLIVEDNADMQKYLASCLKGYEIHITENGEKGIEKAKEINPDLIVSDVMMPVMDGYEMTKKVKNNELLSHIPIIMLTAKASEESLLEGFECEADDYLTKPFSANELNARIKSQIKNREKLIEKFRKNISVSPSEISTTSTDELLLKKALKIVEENMDKSDFSVEDFVKEVGMSRTNLHRKLKALTELSTTEFIRSIRLKRAAQLIKDNVGNISEIAYQVGFTNLSYFTRCFKEEFKCAPSEFWDKTFDHHKLQTL